MIQLPSAVKAERNEMRSNFRKAMTANNGIEKRNDESQFQVLASRSDRGRVTSGYGAGMQDDSRLECKAYFATLEEAEAMRDEFVNMTPEGNAKAYSAGILVRHGRVFRRN